MSKSILYIRSTSGTVPRVARHESGIAGVQWGRLAACAAVGYRRDLLQARQPQLTKLPHNGAPCLAYTYARILAVLAMNRAGLHFDIAHPQRISLPFRISTALK